MQLAKSRVNTEKRTGKTEDRKQNLKPVRKAAAELCMELIVELHGAEVVQVGLAHLVLLQGPLRIHTEPAQYSTVQYSTVQSQPQSHISH